MTSKKALEEFITLHKLRKEDKSIVFNANVSFYKGDVPQKLPSRIHIITLPQAMVVYIDEFFNEGYQQSELYSTEDFYFRHDGNGVLEIRGYESQPGFPVSIALIG